VFFFFLALRVSDGFSILIHFQVSLYIQIATEGEK